MWMRPITVAETLFIRQAADVLSDEERSTFVDFIARNPEAVDVIPETGGVRKIRWSRQGSGKRGGVRVAYFYYRSDVPLYLLWFTRRRGARICLRMRSVRCRP
jgi:hypothetical protein